MRPGRRRRRGDVLLVSCSSENTCSCAGWVLMLREMVGHSGRMSVTITSEAVRIVVL